MATFSSFRRFRSFLKRLKEKRFCRQCRREMALAQARVVVTFLQRVHEGAVEKDDPSLREQVYALGLYVSVLNGSSRVQAARGWYGERKPAAASRFAGRRITRVAKEWDLPEPDDLNDFGLCPVHQHLEKKRRDKKGLSIESVSPAMVAGQGSNLDILPNVEELLDLLLNAGYTKKQLRALAELILRQQQ